MVKFKRGQLVKVKKEIPYPSSEVNRYSGIIPPHVHYKFELAKIRKVETRVSDGKPLYTVTYGDGCEPVLLEEDEIVEA